MVGINSSQKTKLVKMKDEIENQQLLIKMLQNAKAKLKEELDQLKADITATKKKAY